MTFRKKIVVSVSGIVFVNFLLPLLLVHLAPADWGMGLCIILFFAGIPAASLCWGIAAGSDIKKLWWIPITGAFSFPIFFSLAVWGAVWELFSYSLFYALIGGAAMAVTHYTKQYKERRK